MKLSISFMFFTAILLPLIASSNLQGEEDHDSSNEGAPIKYPNSDFSPSLVAVLANLDKFHGKKIQLQGYLVVEFEGIAVYLSKDDADYGITSNGFWVSFDSDTISFKDAQKFNDKYVLLEGRFDKDSRGHFSMWQGSLEDVDRVLELKKVITPNKRHDSM